MVKIRKKVEYRYNNGNWQEYTVGSSVIIPSDLQGIINLDARVTDNVGNISTIASSVAKVDTTKPVKPVINLSNSNWTVPGVTFNISSISDAHSGVKKVEFRDRNNPGGGEAPNEDDEDEIRFAIDTVKTLEPAGVGAQGLKECFLLQLRKRKKKMQLL